MSTTNQVKHRIAAAAHYIASDLLKEVGLLEAKTHEAHRMDRPEADVLSQKLEVAREKYDDAKEAACWATDMAPFDEKVAAMDAQRSWSGHETPNLSLEISHLHHLVAEAHMEAAQ